jgi:hypothetical protein
MIPSVGRDPTLFGFLHKVNITSSTNIASREIVSPETSIPPCPAPPVFHRTVSEILYRPLSRRFLRASLRSSKARRSCRQCCSRLLDLFDSVEKFHTPIGCFITLPVVERYSSPFRKLLVATSPKMELISVGSSSSLPMRRLTEHSRISSCSPKSGFMSLSVILIEVIENVAQGFVCLWVYEIAVRKRRVGEGHFHQCRSLIVQQMSLAHSGKGKIQ